MIMLQVALSLMTMIHNSVCENEDKIHLINEMIMFTKGVDEYETNFFPKLMAILEANGFKFQVTTEKKSTKFVPESLLSKVSYKNLPHVYLAKDEDDGRLYVGVRWGKGSRSKGEGSSSHKNNKKTALTNFPDEKKHRMYQQKHHKIDDVKMVKAAKDFLFNEGADEEEIALKTAQNVIFDEMEVDAKKKEALAQFCCIVGKMLGVKVVNGHPTKLIFQKYHHYDDGFSLSLFTHFFGYIFGCGIEVEIPKLVKDDNGKVLLKLF